MATDIIDAFERRIRDFKDIPKMTSEEKMKLRDALVERIESLQKEMNEELLKSKKKIQTPTYKTMALSQMMLLWFYDQLNFGKH